MSETNKLLAGIWFGESKPSVNTFFKPAYDTMHKLFTDGILVTSQMFKGHLSPMLCSYQVLVIYLLKQLC